VALERPFEGAHAVAAVLPTAHDALDAVERAQVAGIGRMIEEHATALSRELGAQVVPTTTPPAAGPRWLVGPARCNAALRALARPEPSGPELHLDRRGGLLVSDGRSYEEVKESFSYLRSLARFPGGTWRIGDCPSLGDAVERLATEIACSSPAPAYRGLDWRAATQRHGARVLAARDPIAAMQEWLAELHDAHTWVHPVPPHGEFPYDVRVDKGVATFVAVPEGSPAWLAGVRCGHRLEEEDVTGWWRRTAASPQLKPLLTGRRMLETPLGTLRRFVARSPEGLATEWYERPAQERWSPLVEHRRLASGHGYLRIAAWTFGRDLETRLDEAFDALRGARRLIVDLRGNPGGNLALAHGFRNRFLRRDGAVGWVATTLPDGRLGPLEPIHGEPAPPAQCWNGDAVFLTDAMTYSSSEDALLGLQGLPHIRVIGQRSGGGSGRLRMIRLLPGWRLTISTALTFDLHGRCIEGNGIPVDVEVPLGGHVLDVAERL
jgi:carboxyl-terminal processing protease